MWVVTPQVLSLAACRLRRLCDELGLQRHRGIVDLVWTCVKFAVTRRQALFRNRHLDHALMCAVYAVAKLHRVRPEVTFKRIIRAYKLDRTPDQYVPVIREIDLTPVDVEGPAAAPADGPPGANGGGAHGGHGGANGNAPSAATSAATSPLLGNGGGGATNGGGPGVGQPRLAPPALVRRGDIIAFYNKLFIPLMKKFVVRMKEKAAEKKQAQLAQQQQTMTAQERERASQLGAAGALVSAAAIARQQARAI